MARPPRLQIANGIYHVSARGNERSLIYRDDIDRQTFLEVLAEVGERYDWRLLCYCLLGNHYHLLVQTPDPNLARGMRQLNGVYAQTFNRRHSRVGHLLQGRYSARLVQADEHLLGVVRYIVRNPVRAGLCEEPGEWRWSSHRATLGERPRWFLDVETLLSQYAPAREIARERYRAHVDEPEGDEDSLHPLIAGDDAFIATTLEGLLPPAGIPRRYLQGPRPALPTLLAGADADALARAHAHGYTLREIARHLGVNASTVSRRLRRWQAQTRSATNGT
jgi:putative transposase